MLNRKIALVGLLASIFLPASLGIGVANGILQIPGTVCATDSSSTTCPQSGVYTSLTAPYNSQLKVAVDIARSPRYFNGYNVAVTADNGVLNATGVDFTGSILPVNSTTLKVLCVNGAGTGCATQDSPGTVHVLVNATGYNNLNITGRLFTVTYTVRGLTTDTTIGFTRLLVTQTPNGVCIETCKILMLESDGLFGNLPSIVPGYMVTITPSFSYNPSNRLLSGAFAVTVANDTDGAILYTKIITFSLHVSLTNIAGFVLAAPFSTSSLGAVLSLDTTTGSVQGRVLGNPDIDHDGMVNIIDMATIALAFGAVQGSPNYNPAFDLNQDGVINIIDIVLIGTAFFLPTFY